MFLSLALCYLVIHASIATQFSDQRCKCFCPSLSVVPLGENLTDNERRVYIGVVEKEQCNCEKVVFELNIKTNLSDDFQRQFCPRCQCIFELRRTDTVRIVVSFIVIVVALLMAYMAILLFLEPNVESNVQAAVARNRFVDEQHEDQAIGSRSDNLLEVDEPFSEESTPNRIINRMSRKQTEWQRTVEKQRENVFDDDGTIFG